jgi:hypothetical protein
MLRNMVIGDLDHVPAPLDAASGSVRDGVTGLDVNGRRKCSIYGYVPLQGTPYLRASVCILDTCTRLVGTSYGVTLEFYDWTAGYQWLAEIRSDRALGIAFCY